MATNLNVSIVRWSASIVVIVVVGDASQDASARLREEDGWF